MAKHAGYGLHVRLGSSAGPCDAIQ